MAGNLFSYSLGIAFQKNGSRSASFLPSQIMPHDERHSPNASSSVPTTEAPSWASRSGTSAHPVSPVLRTACRHSPPGSPSTCKNSRSGCTHPYQPPPAIPTLHAESCRAVPQGPMKVGQRLAYRISAIRLVRRMIYRMGYSIEVRINLPDSIVRGIGPVGCWGRDQKTDVGHHHTWGWVVPVLQICGASR